MKLTRSHWAVIFLIIIFVFILLGYANAFPS